MKNSWRIPIILNATLIVLGVALQLTVGDFDASWLRYPWSAIVAVNYLYLLVLCYTLDDKWQWLKSLRSRQSSVVSLASMLFMTLIFGLTRQDGSAERFAGALGFTRMTSSWVFNLVLLNFLTSLGLALVDDWRCFRSRKIAPLLSHTAVFVALAAAMFSSGDKARYRLVSYLETPTYTAQDEYGRERELPFVVTLRDFSIEEYAPNLHLYDARSEALSEWSLSVEDSVGGVGNWQLKVLKHIPMAGVMPEAAEYLPMQHVGATHAAYVVAENAATGSAKEGWVSCGSHIFAPSTLDLGSGEYVVMPQPKAKRYLSRVRVEDNSGEVHDFDVEVNHPAKVGAWRIYQVGYDAERGRWSTQSTFECVRDGWWGIVSVALWMILASAVVMFFGRGNKASKSIIQNSK